MRIEVTKKYRWLDGRVIAGTLAIAVLGLAASLRPTAAFADDTPAAAAPAAAAAAPTAPPPAATTPAAAKPAAKPAAPAAGAKK